ncbi:dentin sialophosphoprotein-like isoform X2 [Oncorhynchus clarkii lewisi]|uniref:dentin sialophosphoprotein-like isoform X2 n=1 Tax=Oncorhynchus clarkii lewisi TaxID=490388 RepID=UPI0039B9178E
MELSLCSLSVLTLVAVVFMVPMKDRSEDVLSFLNGALDVAPATQSTSGKIKGPENTFGKPAPTPGRPSPLRPTENSAEMSNVTQTANSACLTDSDARSKEKCNSNDLTDAERSESNSAESREDYDDSLGSNTKITQTVTDDSSSDETDSSPSDVRKYKQPPGRRTINPDHVDSMQTTTRQDPTNGSEVLDRETQRDPTVGRERTSRVLIDLNSEEDVMVGCQGTVCVPGEQGTTVNGGENDENTSLNSRDRDIQSQEVTGTATEQALRRDSCRGVVNGVLDTAREQQDLDSMEHVNGRPNGTDEAKSRETRDDISTETNPVVIG